MEVQLTAREMFEKLGYEKIERQDDYGNYIEYYTGEDDCIRITFYLEDKKIGIGDYILFSLDIFKAINQQCKELGWDNE